MFYIILQVHTNAWVHIEIMLLNSLYWQARMAIKNATRIEESTKKWLSMMARDCNRFCKIMVCSSSHTIEFNWILILETKKFNYLLLVLWHFLELLLIINCRE